MPTIAPDFPSVRTGILLALSPRAVPPSSDQSRDHIAVRRVAIDVPDAARAAGRTGSILLVTDDVELGEACRRALERAGFRVTVVRHSVHAVLACRSEAPIDILVTELSMPDGSGPALAERLRAYHAALQPLYFARAGTMYEADNVLVRPFTRDDLLGRLNRLLSLAR